ncbi:MAG: phosphoribosylformylglycinamidine cyclo-ligase [Planctomycetaceae bacterium]|nr:phosphoribosylformylglycinamidine cyclo-ligase [Planctomycetota bacterium]NUN53577.1 phosphoribosylformylglycinamidine cyclo-ligase [Planctomycetaceae bacterium]
MNRASAYARAGVDIDRKMKAIGSAKDLFASTFDGNVLGGIGGFGSLYRFRPGRMRDPLLCASADGVGTKLKLAFALDRHDTVGQDIVNHCVNDILVQGARPLFLLDYVASGRLRPGTLRSLFSGLAKACRENGCSLVGGETAEMPGMYPAGEYDLAATIVGVVDRKDLLPRRGVRPGDVLLGLPSTGLHTNGYTLARKVLVKRPADLRKRVAELGGTLGEALLAVHRSYAPVLLPLLPSGRIKALAHITGGGFQDNVPRVLPKNCTAVIDPAAWEVPPLFRMIVERGRVSREEAYRVFNMGMGMVVVVAQEDVSAAIRDLRRRGAEPSVIGYLRRGGGDCVLAS